MRYYYARPSLPLISPACIFCTLDRLRVPFRVRVRSQQSTESGQQADRRPQPPNSEAGGQSVTRRRGMRRRIARGREALLSTRRRTEIDWMDAFIP